MFLSRRSNSIYYLWLDDELGKTRKISAGCKHKSDALQFLGISNPRKLSDSQAAKNVA